MASLDRTSFVGGWQPDQDEIGAPPNVCLRMDNLTLDQLGTLSLRLGSTILQTLATPDCHVLFTAILNGTRLRFANAGANVYCNGGLLVSGTNAGDRAFGTYRGQTFISDPAGTGNKYDGTTLRTWGIAMTGGVPTAVAGAVDGVTLATGALTEIPGFVVTEPSGSATWSANQLGVANGAVFCSPSLTTHRAVVLKEFFTPFNATVYAGGTAASDNDLLTLWVYVQEPTAVLDITVMVDVNTSGSTPPFQSDYYTAQFTQDVSQLLNYLNPAFTIQAPGTVSYTQAEAMLRGSLANAPSALLTITGGQWTQLAIVRGSFLRSGSTEGHDWSTVKAVQVVINQAPSDTNDVVIGLSDVAFEVANEVGSYQWAYQYGFNSAPSGSAAGVGYVGLSAPSAFSTALQTQSANTTLTIPPDPLRDPQVNIIYLYRFVLNNYYQTASQVITPGTTAAVSILDPMGDVLALETDLVLVTDILPPPTGVIAIAGAYYDRLFVLTANALAMSEPINPDSFRTSRVIWEAGADETPLWCKKTFFGVYVGTTKDIYRVDGTAADLPDGSVDVLVTPLSIDHPPINTAIAQDGNLLTYCASDGWRSVSSSGSQSLVGNTSLLYAKQLVRYGVGPINVKTGRFQAVVQQRQLVAITPEGLGSSNVPINFVSRVATTTDWPNVPPLILAPQTHMAGNLLVVTVNHENPAGQRVTAVTNTAGDVFVPSPSSPFSDVATARVQEIWYCLSSRGHAADVVEVVLPSAVFGWTAACLEFSSLGTFAFLEDSTGSAEPFPASSAPMASGTLALSGPSLIVGVLCTLQTAQGTGPPLNPSGTQNSEDGNFLLWDSYQFTAVSGTCHWTASGPGGTTQVGWGVLAAAFNATIGAGGNPLASPVLYREAPVVSSWYRHVYPTQWRSLFVEPDGTLIGGDLSGVVWQLDTGTTDNGALIPVTFWTKADDASLPFARKDPWYLNTLLDTGGQPVTLSCCLNDSGVVAAGPVVSPNGLTLTQVDVDAMGPFLQVQLRITGSCSVFRFASFSLGYRARPPIMVFTEQKPEQSSPVRRRFGGLTIVVDTLGLPATVTPILDDVALTPFTVTASDPVSQTFTFPAVVGRDLWASVASPTGFELYQVAPIVTETLPQIAQGLTPRQLGESLGVKILSGVQIRVCTLGVARVITAVLDGVLQTAVTATSPLSEPIDVTLAFPAALQATEIALTTDGNVELYNWEPLVTSRRPLGVLAWDSGPLDLGTDELVWLRHLWLKVRASATLTITPWFDGYAFPAVTAIVTQPGLDLVLPVDVGRSYVGRQPRLVVTSSAPFYPYWIKVRRRTTGTASDQGDQQIAVTLETGQGS